MDRRSFVGLLGGLGMAATEKRTRFYTLESFKLKAGTELPRLHEHFSKAAPKATKIVLEALIAPHMPQLLVVNGFNSLEEVRSANNVDTGSEPAFESLDTTLLEAAPYSPEITPAVHDKPRIFELRVYHSPTYHQLAALHDRFSGPEIKIFHRVGIHPILYASTLIGQNIPNLTYLIPFDSLADREKAWSAFGADPEWVKVRKESIDKSGQISSVQNISLWKAVR